jgi:hypothetical protein
MNDIQLGDRYFVSKIVVCFVDNVHNVKVSRNSCGAVEMSHIAVYHTSSKSALDRNNGSAV